MHPITFGHEGLGNSSYLLDCGDGTAVVIDPDRSVDRYLEAARGSGLDIVSVLETHLHADFVSGARELSHATGATHRAPATAHIASSHAPVRPGDRLRLGEVLVEAIASPGHAPEHLSYLVRAGAAPPSLFSGGSLIVGGAARTDLLGADMTEALTRAQHRTLTTAFEALPDETGLFPTHGGGSFCSVGDARRHVSTLGEERRTNPLLAIASEDEFASSFPSSFPAVPAYFWRLRKVNRQGPRLRSEIAPPSALGVDRFEAVGPSALVVDARPFAEYARAHVPGSLSNPWRPAFGVWLGWLAPADSALAFVADRATVEDATVESLLVGYEDFAGWLADGIGGWEKAGKPLAHVAVAEPAATRAALRDGAVALDVREPGEHASGHLPEAVNISLGQLAERAAELPRDRPVFAYCGHGDRASSGVSILERMGFTDLAILEGGLDRWRRDGLETENGPR